MSAPVDVTIIVPVHNDEEWIATALESCLAQSHERIEVICVDDASTDGTDAVIEAFEGRDPRIRLIRMETNVSALQGRRVGVEAARGAHVLFLDGDDELEPHAVEKALAKAESAGADLVGFGVRVLNTDGLAVGGYQSRLRPVHAELEGREVLRGLFPVGKPAQGQLWRYLFSTALLREAYAMIPDGLYLRRVNDLPVMFLVAALARHYVSIHDRLYRYHFRRGGSGQRVAQLSEFEFYLGAVESIDSIAEAVRSLAEAEGAPAQLLESYDSARLSMIGNVLGYLQKNVEPALRTDSLRLLHERESMYDVVRAAVRFAPGCVELLAAHDREDSAADGPVRSVLLVSATLTTGGVSGVLLSQARFLLAAGYRVTIAARRAGSDLSELPAGAEFVEVEGSGLVARLDAWADICRRFDVDVVIDHQILYSRDWPAYALMARGVGARTIGWIHNFGLRPILDQKTLSSFLATHLNALSTVVTLSPLDVAFWKLRGIPHAVYLPNPPSPMLLESAAAAAPKSAPEGTLQLVWVGRLDQHTKQVRALLDVAAELKKLALPFHLTMIGPEWAGLTADDLQGEAKSRGLDQLVSVVGPLRGEALLEAIDAADIFVTTSIIEGFQLTLAEAQARGLPVAMYELPWLTLVQDNDGLVAVPQGDAAGLAAQIAALAEDPERYARLSAASLVAADHARRFDFQVLYQQLIEGELPAEFSPEPTLDDARQLLDWTIFFVEHNVTLARDNPPSIVASVSESVSASRDLLSRVARRAVREVPALKPWARKAGRFLRR